MKNYINLIVIALLFGFAFTNVNAQDVPLKKVETVNFEVDGVCGMCESRIEKAALIKGVKLAEWNKETKQLKVIYSTKKVTVLQIQQTIAAVGYDTPLVKAKEEAYGNLPGCCMYRDGVETH